MQEIPDAKIPLSPRQESAIAALNAAQVREIDDALMGTTHDHWRKVAMVVATTMDAERWGDVPDVFYADRVRELVAKGMLESQGDLGHMRYSEVRRPK